MYRSNFSAANTHRYKSILVIRHGRPALSRSVWINWQGYRKWWVCYDESGLDKQQNIPQALMKKMQHTQCLFSSPMQRAVETAETLNQTSLEIQKNTVFIEAALPPPHFPLWWKMTPRVWGFFARLFWCLGWSDGMESQKQARMRVEKSARILLKSTEKHQQIALTAHGWFNRMIKKALLKAGCSCVYQCGDGYWSWRLYRVPENLSTVHKED